MLKEHYKNKTTLAFVIIIILLYTINLNVCQSANINDVIINEIAWMGTTESANNEWIELYNPTNQDISLTDWTLKATDGKPDISLNGIIPAQEYFLIERTDDKSIPDIPANIIRSFGTGLNNDGEYLELRDDKNTLIDFINGSNKWNDFGDKDTKQTMERIETGWQTSQNVGGTPKASNSSGSSIPAQKDQKIDNDKITASSTPIKKLNNQPPIAKAGSDITALVNQEIILDASQSQDPDMDKLTFFWNFGDGASDISAATTHTYTTPGQYIATLQVNDKEFSDLDIITINIYSPSIIISEFMPNPADSDTENEWIELYNKSEQIANLTNWRIDDQEKGSKPFIFPENSLIAPHQYLVLRRAITKLSLNNNEDSVRLIYPNGDIASQVTYSNNKKENYSVAFDGKDYFWTAISTPGTVNIISNEQPEKEKNNSSNNPKPIIKQTSEAPVSIPKNIISAQSFSALDALDTPPSNLTSKSNIAKTQDFKNEIDKQNQNLADKIKLPFINKTVPLKANLILIFSIIISGSLLASWGVIILKKRVL